MKGKLIAWLEIARISNLPTAWTNVLAGWLLAGGCWDRVFDIHRLGLLLGAGSLAYIGGMVLNDAFDARWDREHRRERPVPSGRLTQTTASWTGAALLVMSWFLFIWGANAELWTVSGLMLAILLYNGLHKRWAGSVLIMGGCRGLLYLSAGLESGSSLASTDMPLLWCGASAIAIYVVGLTLVARYESRGIGPGRWIAWISRELLYVPGVLLILTGFAELVGRRDVAAMAPFVAFVVLLRLILPVIRKGGEQVGRAVGWLLAGIALVDAMAISLVQPELAVWIGALVPLLRLWQRKIAAT